MLKGVLLLLSGLTFVANVWAQQDASRATQENATSQLQDEVRVLTEEVVLGVTATDANGRFIADLTADDLQITEDKVVQQVQSVRREAASVLLLIDTGTNVSMTKTLPGARLAAQSVVEVLAHGNRLAVMQFNERVTLLQAWTEDKATVEATIETKLMAGKVARFSEALKQACESFKDLPQTNRHLIVMSDGIEPATLNADKEGAAAKCLRDNVTIHIISFAKFKTEESVSLNKIVRKRKLKEGLARAEEENRLRVEHGENSLIYQMKTTPGGITVNLDVEQIERLRAYRKQAEISETVLAQMAEDAGGDFYAPQTVAELTGDALRLARRIAAQYVLTYRPTTPLNSTASAPLREIRVTSRRADLQLQARRKYILIAR